MSRGMRRRKVFFNFGFSIFGQWHLVIARFSIKLQLIAFDSVGKQFISTRKSKSKAKKKYKLPSLLPKSFVSVCASVCQLCVCTMTRWPSSEMLAIFKKYNNHKIKSWQQSNGHSSTTTTTTNNNNNSKSNKGNLCDKKEIFCDFAN